VCISKEYGGLGVRQLREFNTVFIRKMCWRLLVNKPGLWYRVVVARYGESEERVRLGGRGASSWWREILRLREGSGEGEGGCFVEGVERKVGDGSGRGGVGVGAYKCSA
jgi:hypothetical protein